MKKKLVIINNEKCNKENNELFCENIEMKSISDNLKSKFDIKFFLRKGKISPVYKLDKSIIEISSNIFIFTKKIIKSIFNDNANYLIISVTPYTFYSFILLFLFRKKTYLYLRSDGRKEIIHIYGTLLSNLYKIAENIMSYFCTLIVVNKLLSNKENYFLVNPSQIDKDWLVKSNIKPNREKIKLLYVGRIKVEKGVFSLISLFKKVIGLNKDITLTIIGSGKIPNEKNPKIKFVNPVSYKKDLINYYDTHTIFVLPSFTEGHPQVLLESLSRQKPVIVFDEIKHVAENYNGIFITKRNPHEFKKTIEHIDANYEKILNEIKENKYPSKENFFEQLFKILN
mgnify:CR=1 FL=1|tara:strand:- start:1558 stop:2580 length:1023 start_codon:yes stop_codon:yes gene_type:complete